MSKEKFTPAPWKIGFMKNKGMVEGLGVFEEKVGDGERCNAICMVAPVTNIVPEDDANAHLISAAPEMYGILSLLEERLICQLNEYESDAAIKDEEAERILKALSKARGEKTVET